MRDLVKDAGSIAEVPKYQGEASEFVERNRLSDGGSRKLIVVEGDVENCGNNQLRGRRGTVGQGKNSVSGLFE